MADPDPHSSRTRRWSRAYGAWFLVLFGLSSIPGNHLGPQPFVWFDKVEHAGFFFLGGLILGGWVTAAGAWPSRWWLLPLAAAVVGAFDELHQVITPRRSGLDWADWVADVTGGTLAVAAVEIIRRVRRARAGRAGS